MPRLLCCYLQSSKITSKGLCRLAQRCRDRPSILFLLYTGLSSTHLHHCAGCVSPLPATLLKSGWKGGILTLDILERMFVAFGSRDLLGFGCSPRLVRVVSKSQPHLRLFLRASAKARTSFLDRSRCTDTKMR